MCLMQAGIMRLMQVRRPALMASLAAITVAALGVVQADAAGTGVRLRDGVIFEAEVIKSSYFSSGVRSG